MSNLPLIDHNYGLSDRSKVTMMSFMCLYAEIYERCSTFAKKLKDLFTVNPLMLHHLIVSLMTKISQYAINCVL